jgi:hypothetical protein
LGQLTEIPGIEIPEYSEEEIKELLTKPILKNKVVIAELNSIDTYRLRQLLYHGVIQSEISFSTKKWKMKFGLRSSIPQDTEVGKDFSFLWISLHIEYIVIEKDWDITRGIFYVKSIEDLEYLDSLFYDLPEEFVNCLYKRLTTMDTYVMSLIRMLNSKSSNLFQSSYLWGVLGSMVGFSINPKIHYSFLSAEYGGFQEQYIAKMRNSEKTQWTLEAYRLTGFANPFNGKQIIQWVDKVKAMGDSNSEEHDDLLESLKNYINDVDDDHEKIMNVWRLQEKNKGIIEEIENQPVIEIQTEAWKKRISSRSTITFE